jgi:hypothetical protein
MFLLHDPGKIFLPNGRLQRCAGTIRAPGFPSMKPAFVQGVPFQRRKRRPQPD